MIPVLRIALFFFSSLYLYIILASTNIRIFASRNICTTSNTQETMCARLAQLERASPPQGFRPVIVFMIIVIIVNSIQGTPPGGFRNCFFLVSHFRNLSSFILGQLLSLTLTSILLMHLPPPPPSPHHHPHHHHHHPTGAPSMPHASVAISIIIIITTRWRN